METLYIATKLLIISIVIFMTSYARDTDFKSNIDSGKYKSQLLFNVAKSTSKSTATDNDVSTGLILHMPFDKKVTEKTVGVATLTATGTAMEQVQGLRSIQGVERNRLVLRLRPDASIKVKNSTPTVNWSVAFMMKRVGDLDADIQTVISNGSSVSAPFIGFKRYNANAGVAGCTEFITEPLYANLKAKSVPGLFMDAEKVRSLDEWVHYLVTYNNASKETQIYMNGELVTKSTISNSETSNLANFTIGMGTTTMPGVYAQMADLMIWNQVLTEMTVKKIFLMSYYGFTK